MSRDLIENGLAWTWSAERVHRALRNPEVLSVMACERERVVAFALTQFSDERAHLSLFAVEPGHQRQGIGRRLIEWTLESAYAAGIATIHLETRAANHAARRFYRALGFKENAYIPGYYGGREMALKMIRELRRPGIPEVRWRLPAPPSGSSQ
jgi:ribosomal protein S18 acetylase RimI-like enzyme